MVSNVGMVLAVTAWGPQWAPIYAAALAGLIAVGTLTVNVTAGRRDRRRNLYSDAYRATMAWIEMAYRAYHASPEDDDKFLDCYHKLWEDVRYYQGWLLLESPELGYSFAQFKEAVQRVCEGVIESAWMARPPRRSRSRRYPWSPRRRPSGTSRTASSRTRATSSPPIPSRAPA